MDELEVSHKREQSVNDSGDTLGTEIGVFAAAVCFKSLSLNISGQEIEEFKNEFDDKHEPESTVTPSLTIVEKGQCFPLIYENFLIE